MKRLPMTDADAEEEGDEAPMQGKRTRFTELQPAAEDPGTAPAAVAAVSLRRLHLLPPRTSHSSHALTARACCSRRNR